MGWLLIGGVIVLLSEEVTGRLHPQGWIEVAMVSACPVPFPFLPGIGLTFDLNAILASTVLEVGVALGTEHKALGCRESRVRRKVVLRLGPEEGQGSPGKQLCTSPLVFQLAPLGGSRTPPEAFLQRPRGQLSLLILE